MTIEELGNLGDLIGALATTATLLYLAVQIRQNSKTMQANSIANYTQVLSEISSLLAENEILCDLYFKGLQNPELLTDSERRRFFIILGNYVMCLTQGDQMDSAGVLSSDLHHHYSVQLDWLVCQPGFKFWLENWGGILPPTFLKKINQSINVGAATGRQGIFRDNLP